MIIVHAGAGNEDRKKIIEILTTLDMIEPSVPSIDSPEFAQLFEDHYVKMMQEPPEPRKGYREGLRDYLKRKR